MSKPKTRELHRLEPRAVLIIQGKFNINADYVPR